MKPDHSKNARPVRDDKNVKTNNRPQNKDDLDSREGEEQLTKGDDVTHNKKEKKSEGKK